MRSISDWLSAYGESHQNKTNRIIHKICVPLIVWSLVALLWSLKVFDIRLAYPAALICLAFYFNLSWRSGLIMWAQFSIFFAITWALEMAMGSVRECAVVIFILAWVGQFVGHKIEGRKPSFFEDLQFLLIGPLWVVHSFRR